ncbi:MAG: NUDIX hydrolase [Sphingomonadales bacterium]
MNDGQTSREYPDRPLVGIGGIVFKGDAVLLVKRAKPPRQGAWSLPGGMQELGETVLETLRREISEETGLEISVGGLVDVIDFIEPDDDGQARFHYTLIDYWAEWAGGDLKAGGDAAEAVWAVLADLESFGLPERTAGLIRKANQMRRSGKPVALPKHTIRGHFRAAGIAVVFGLSAYGAIHLLIWLMKLADLL